MFILVSVQEIPFQKQKDDPNLFRNPLHPSNHFPCVYAAADVFVRYLHLRVTRIWEE